MKETKRKTGIRIFSVLLMAVLAFTAAPVMSGQVTGTSSAAYAASETPKLTATGKISESGVNLRKSASASSRSLKTLKAGTKVKIHYIVFTDKNSIKKATRWYRVTAGKTKGYVNAAYVDSIKYSKADALAADELNYRKGPGTGYTVYSSVGYGTEITLLLKAYGPDDDTLWYKAKVAGRTAYVCGDYIRVLPPLKTPTAKQLEGRSDLAVSLLTNPTRGGWARYVDTFSSDNCSILFAVNGYMGVSTPQGLAYTGKEYYVLYGNNVGQRIVTYSATGERLAATKFKFAIGHPNGITWDPQTGLCYIFKGHKTRMYTWDPKTNKFKKARSPYVASGGAYDRSTKQLYATSKSALYVYSGDGSFRTLKIFDRAWPGIAHSAQDCGAGGGFLFHGVSGTNYRTTNFLDIYRTEDGAYLGSVKIKLGEIESAIVGKGGYLYLLINVPGKTDIIYKTPLNVKDLQF